MTDPVKLLDQYYDGTLSEQDARDLCNYIKENPENARKIMLAAFVHSNLNELLGGLNTLHNPAAACFSLPDPVSRPSGSARYFWRTRTFRYGAAAAVLALAALATLPLWHSEQTPLTPAPVASSPSNAGVRLAATINADWDIASFQAGTQLPMGTLRLRSGLAQIQFPSGTTVVIAGPAEFTIASDSQIQLERGSLTSVVSQKGIGFSVVTPGCTLTDLGTEFGIYVDRSQLTHAEVFKGKVRITGAGQNHENQTLLAGQAVQVVSAGAPLQPANLEPLAFTTPAQFAQIASAGGDPAFARWSVFSDALRSHPKTLAYYNFEKLPLLPASLPNIAASTHGSFAGVIDGPTWDQGRFPAKAALRFAGGKSAVHINIPSPLNSFTIAAWVNPENFATADQVPLGNRFTALLLSDGVREGAVHWQIMDGRRIELGLSLGKFAGNPDSSLPPPASFQHYWSNYDALSAGDLNHWLFIAVVVNPDTREVRHYCNGNLTGIAPIDIPTTALIGPAEIGNWNPQSTRADAIRGFNGRMDELAVIARPLSDQEVEAMYNAGGGR